MATKLSFFPVGNGDMTLIQTESGKSIMIDVNIRAAADDPNDDTLDVAHKLREILKRDKFGRKYVDVLLISHPDKDHCTGLQKHFHLDSPDTWSPKSDKIFVKEIWSSPMVFRRASKKITLCDDAREFNREARRRVQIYRDPIEQVCDGNRILILGEDETGKTDDLNEILICVNERFSQINGENDTSVAVRLLGPLPKGSDDDEELLSKNNSSTILQFSLSGGGISDKCRFLTGGDAEVAIWEKLWSLHKNRTEWLSYDVLLAPHHCSWHCISYDSQTELGGNAKVCMDAFNALSRARDGATIVASSVVIKDDGNDPPSIRAKQEYQKIVKSVSGDFKCVGEHPSERSLDILEIEITIYGAKILVGIGATIGVVSSPVIGRQPLHHG